MKASDLALLLLCVSAPMMASCGSQSMDSARTGEGNSQPQSPTDGNHRNGAAEATPSIEDPEDALGQRFLAALQENDPEKYHACWLRIQDMEALIEKPPPDMPVPSEEEFSQMREYLSKRDDVIRLTFPVLRRAMIDKCGDLATLTISDVVAVNVSVQNGQKGAGRFEVVLSTSDNREVEYHVDDGAFVNDRWYFSDTPDTMLMITTANGDSKCVFLSEYAMEAEKAKLKDLGAM